MLYYIFFILFHFILHKLFYELPQQQVCCYKRKRQKINSRGYLIRLIYMNNCHK